MHRNFTRRGLTPVELGATLVAGGLVAALFSSLAISAAERHRASVCLKNLRELGVAIHMYADLSQGVLPGPTHFVIAHRAMDPNMQMSEYERQRYLSTRLAAGLGSFDDRAITCPTATYINPDKNFNRFFAITGRAVRVSHFVLNSYGRSAGEGGGPSDNVRATNPQFYFGYSSPAPDLNQKFYPPQRLAKIPNAAREWMIADAWYRPANAFPADIDLQQEGPFQSNWTGESLPYFAPHGRRDHRPYIFENSTKRGADMAANRESRGDGVTNTLFFGGHAGPVPSKTAVIGEFEVLYGFPGTVNRLTPAPFPYVWR